MLKLQDETTASALSIGMVVAVVWGIGVSLYVFYMGPQVISWTVWGARLLGGIAACVAVPVVFVRGRVWVAGSRSGR